MFGCLAVAGPHGAAASASWNHFGSTFGYLDLRAAETRLWSRRFPDARFTQIAFPCTIQLRKPLSGGSHCPQFLSNIIIIMYQSGALAWPLTQVMTTREGQTPPHSYIVSYINPSYLPQSQYEPTDLTPFLRLSISISSLCLLLGRKITITKSAPTRPLRRSFLARTKQLLVTITSPSSLR